MSSVSQGEAEGKCKNSRLSHQSCPLKYPGGGQREHQVSCTLSGSAEGECKKSSLRGRASPPQRQRTPIHQSNRRDGILLCSRRVSGGFALKAIKGTEEECQGPTLSSCWQYKKRGIYQSRATQETREGVCRQILGGSRGSLFVTHNWLPRQRFSAGKGLASTTTKRHQRRASRPHIVQLCQHQQPPGGRDQSSNNMWEITLEISAKRMGRRTLQFTLTGAGPSPRGEPGARQDES